MYAKICFLLQELWNIMVLTMLHSLEIVLWMMLHIWNTYRCLHVFSFNTFRRYYRNSNSYFLECSEHY